MKKTSKQSVKIEWKNAKLYISEGHLIVVEYDKDGKIVDETIFMEEIDELIGEDGLTISIKKEKDIN